MTVPVTLLTLLLPLLMTLTQGFPRYQKNIPNGASVPNPCGTGTWDGVGHFLVQGTGKLNGFGEAFAAEGHVWTTALCRADSDNDGVSNGEELGDRHCHWTSTNNAHLQPPKSHPGICEPVGSANCAFQHFKCH